MEEQTSIYLNASQVVKPIVSNINEITTEKRYITFIFPVLIVLLLLFGGIFLGSILVMNEKSSRAYFRNLVLPVRRVTFILASYLTTMLILMVEAIIVVLFAYLFFKLHFTYVLAIQIFVIASVFVFLGMMIGYFSRTTEVCMLTSIALVALLLFLSNVILPIEAIAYLREVAAYNPFTIAASIVKENMLLSMGFQFQSRYIALLFGYLIVIFAATLVGESISKRRV